MPPGPVGHRSGGVEDGAAALLAKVAQTKDQRVDSELSCNLVDKGLGGEHIAMRPQRSQRRGAQRHG